MGFKYILSPQHGLVSTEILSIMRLCIWAYADDVKIFDIR